MLIPTAADGTLVLLGPGVLSEPMDVFQPLTADAPAIELMTDFRRVRVCVVAPERHVDAALQDMIVEGVRALVVVEEGWVRGLITATDILGPRPIQFLQSPLCDGNPCRHEDVHVGEIMTPWAELRLITMDWIMRSNCADVAVVFSATEATHLLVISGSPNAPATVCGLLSRTRLARQVAFS